MSKVLPGVRTEAELVPTMIRLPKDLDLALRTHAAETDRTIAATIRRALREYLDKDTND